jgi:N-acetylglucosaminylphosphatidylinositol deacetylase
LRELTADVQIITFDHDGITRHPNHVSLHYAVEAYTRKTPSHPRPLYLRSPSVYTKFTGPLFPSAYVFRRNIVNAWESLVPGPGVDDPPAKPTNIVVAGSVWNWIIGWKAMLEHKTQLVWFRWLYLAFSRLLWMNELVVAA